MNKNEFFESEEKFNKSIFEYKLKIEGFNVEDLKKYENIPLYATFNSDKIYFSKEDIKEEGFECDGAFFFDIQCACTNCIFGTFYTNNNNILVVFEKALNKLNYSIKGGF